MTARAATTTARQLDGWVAQIARYAGLQDKTISARIASSASAISPARSAAITYVLLQADDPECELDDAEPGPNECVVMKRLSPARYPLK